jgi:2,3-bisphosphoglycerate-independent phosphoglycerate mutase
MKYCVVVIDGAAGWPLPERESRTSLELACTPNLDAMAREGVVGLSRTIPEGMEPSSSNACISVFGYDPARHYRGRSAIEARSMGITIEQGEAAFRCNLVAVRDGKMWSYCAGRIDSDQARQLVASLEERLGGDGVHFYPGISYRHICKLAGAEETLQATCTPAHDIPERPISEFLPQGPGSERLRELMERSRTVLDNHPVNRERRSRGEIPANMIWLFWGSGYAPDMPAFTETYGVRAAVTSAVDVINGLALMMGMTVLDIPGVTDGLDCDFAGQTEGALSALKQYDLVIIHIEAPDEAGHAGSVSEKVTAIEMVDREVMPRLSAWCGDSLRVLVMPDHPTPIEVQTHVAEPVPFLLWGPGFRPGRARRFTEAEAVNSGLFIDPGYQVMNRLIQGS